MINNNLNHPARNIDYVGIWLIVGLAGGLALGVVIGDIGVGLAAGLTIGAGIGITLEQRHKHS